MTALSVLRRLWSRLADAYWERDYRRAGSPVPSPERQTRLLARLDQDLAANRDKDHSDARPKDGE